MSAILLGATGWSVDRDEKGNRDYQLDWKILTTSDYDGPATVLACPGLPGVGAFWNIGNDIDPWAYCWPDWKVEQLNKDPERGYLWSLRQHFSTKPISRCQDQSIENPLLEPPRLSGTFQKKTRQVYKNRQKALILSSSHEPFTGKETEFDDNHPTVNIEITLLMLPLQYFAPMIDTVNDGPMWGLPKRCIKLSNAQWERKIYGTCSYYYTVNYQFDVNYNTFDRLIVDRGTMVLKGWNPGNPDSTVQLNPDAIDPSTGKKNYLNPQNFERYKDINGENTPVMLDGKGRPLKDHAAESDQKFIKVDFYEESNFFNLGVPSSL